MNTPHAPSTHVYQIFYNGETRQQVDPGFVPLDNSANARTDWREYWPIRHFLQAAGALDENAYYGFFSPKFHAKTTLTARDVFDFVAQQNGVPEVVSFSPYFDQTAFFVNIFEQAELHHPGLIATTEAFLRHIGYEVNLNGLIGHSRNTIFCNYFVAKPSFWRRWLAINEALFVLCEANATDLARSMNASVEYDDKNGNLGCPLKVFVVERVASFLLMAENKTCTPCRPSALPRSQSRVSGLGDELLIADALKMAYGATGQAEYLNAFGAYRQATCINLG